ncbi:hypothetical protein OROGR_017797 [Orobanche gracilis]
MEQESATTGHEATAAGKAGVAEEGINNKRMSVLVAIDDSDESFHALEWVLDNKILMGGAPAVSDVEYETPQQDSEVITIAHVVEPLPRYAYPGGYVLESSNKAQEQNAARILSRAFEMCREKSVKAKTIILEGDPKDRICRVVEEMSVDLLVVGSRGLGQIKRAFLGSVSDYCVHHAKCAVLVMKPPVKKKSSA